jgi:hypothetical protein
MMGVRHYSFGTSGNPLVQALWMLLGAVLLVGALVMGAVVLSALFALGAVAAGVFALRVWWLRRKLRRDGAYHDPNSTETGGDASEGTAPRLIEGEYTVVAERDERDADQARRRSGRRASR